MMRRRSIKTKWAVGMVLVLLAAVVSQTAIMAVVNLKGAAFNAMSWLGDSYTQRITTLNSMIFRNNEAQANLILRIGWQQIRAQDG